MLTLPIKKKWFDMILSGEKKEEYRENKPYWRKRFKSVWGYPAYWGEHHIICFRNGYSKDSPFFYAECSLRCGHPNPDWVENPYVDCEYMWFILTIHKICEPIQLPSSLPPSDQ